MLGGYFMQAKNAVPLSSPNSLNGKSRTFGVARSPQSLSPEKVKIGNTLPRTTPLILEKGDSFIHCSRWLAITSGLIIRGWETVGLVGLRSVGVVVNPVWPQRYTGRSRDECRGGIERIVNGLSFVRTTNRVFVIVTAQSQIDNLAGRPLVA